ncbi:site-2 protease family protein [Leptolyngbya sp. FACHB-261]|uniref:site-2 protease family protein n=1 Tax=Leptolyngbya sp. FACHB-261 TaxID=2692806 RepID=UPI001687134B|nr:site-2 protease family protein [Leptolyngbya sp. FACHB-261]MBD2103768.1 site-2 protease family protein [Leptolyngbya sp. FACHB-261]
MNGTFRVGSLFGIPFYIHSSWFLVLGLVTWSYGSGLAAQFPGLVAPFPWLVGLFAALLLFTSVVAHELGHSLVALRQGIDVKSITLFLFGGVARLEQESKTPAEAFWVAIAGPLVSLLLFGALTLLGIATANSGAFAAIVGLLASVNLALALFNLIPGLPLDGGNILKALVWKLTGNRYKGVAFASRAGQVLGWLAIASGLLPLVLFGSLGNFWNLLIGWFLLQNAGQIAQSAKVESKLSQFTAADAVSPERPIVSAAMSLRQFADEQIMKPCSGHLVVDAAGQLLGKIDLEDLRSVPTAYWSETQVGDVAKPVESSATVQADQPLLDVVKLLEQRKLSQLFVVGANGVLVGLLEKASILRLMQSGPAVRPA